MPREENLLILKMLQEGTISAEQAAELLAAIDHSEATSAVAPATPATPPAPPTAVVPPVPPVPPTPPEAAAEPADSETTPTEEAHPDAFARARARITAAREKVAGMQEKLAAAQERLDTAEHNKENDKNPWDAVSDALKDVPGARSVTDALRGIDARRIAASARRQARRFSRQLRTSLGDLNFDITLPFGEAARGEPILTEPREITTTVPAGGTLRVRNLLGDIEATTADVPEVRVAARIRAWGDSEEDAKQLAAQISLTVDESESDGPLVRAQHPSQVRNVVMDMKVFVPQGVKVSLLSPAGTVTAREIRGGGGVVLATQSGDIHAHEVAADVAAEAASGDITLEGVMGNIKAGTASGDIELTRAAGQMLKATSQSGDITLRDATTSQVEVETVSGDAQVQKLSGNALRLRTVSGDMSLDDVAVETLHGDTVSGSVNVKPRGPLTGSASVSLSTVSGDAEILLPLEANVNLEVNTRSGDVSARWKTGDNAHEVESSGMSTITETIGEGGARVSVSTVSGDVSLTQASPASDADADR